MAKQIRKSPIPINEPLNEEDVAHDRQMRKFDRYMIMVNRVMDDDVPTTQSVEIGKAIRKGLLTSQKSADHLNRTQDWQNNTAMGQPIIEWYFPSGSVRTGEVLAANDIRNKKNKPIALNIDLTHKLNAEMVD